MNVTGPLVDAELCAQLILAMAHFLWQGAALAMLAALGAWAVRHSPAAKYRVYFFAMLMMAACPAVTCWMLSPGNPKTTATGADATPAAAAIPAPAPFATSSAKPAAQPAPVLVESNPIAPFAMPAASTPAAAAPFAAPAAPQAVPESPDWRRYAPHLAGAYMLGVLLMFTRVLLGLRGAKRLCRRSEPIDDPALLEIVARQARRLGLAVAPRILKCRDVLVPTVAGIVRPVILMPLTVLTGLSPDQIEAIVAHELAHIRRYDHVVQLVQRFIEAVLFFHPAVWFVSRRLHVEREHCCDDAVVRAVGRPVTYAQSLVRVAELCLAERAGAGEPAGARVSLAVADKAGPLRRRVLRVLEGGGTPRLRLARVWVMAVVMAGTVLTATAWYRHATATADEPKPVTEFTGTLVDTSGRPVSNGYITTDGENPYKGVRSDVAGKFTLTGLKPDVRRGVAYSQRSRRMGLFKIPATPPTLPIKLAYHEGDVDGRVVDSSGNPVKGAVVHLFVKNFDGEVYHFNTYGKTDASGYYSTGLVPTAQGLVVHATLSDNPRDDNRTEPVTMAQNFQTEMPDLVVRTATAPSPKPGPQRVRYSGRVVEEGGIPVSGAEIDLSYPKGSMVAGAGTVLTDIDGRFSRLLPPDAERVDMRISHRNFVSFHFGDNVRPAVSALRDGSAVIVLKRGLRLVGVVRDDQGRPLSNALVVTGRLYSSTAGTENEIIEDATSPRTDADGAFEVNGLPPGSREMSVLADGFAPRSLTVDIQRENAPLEVQIDRGVSLSAVVADADGKPIPDAKVGVDEWTVNGREGRLSRFTRSGDDGRFTLDALPTTGTLKIYAGGKGYLGRGFEWSPGGEKLETLTLFKPAVITGVVRDAQTDKPVTEFEVRPGWYWRPGEPFSESSYDGTAKVKDADGRFSKQVERISLGGGGDPPVFAARIVARGYQPQLTPDVHLGKPYEPFVIRLEKAAWVAGVVKDPAGAPAAGARVFLVEPHNVTFVEGLTVNESFTHAPEIRTKADATGAFELPPSPSAKGPGRVLVLHEKGYAIVPADELTGKATPAGAAADVVLMPWARVEGDLVVAGAPVNGVNLTLKAAAERPFDPNAPKDIEFTLQTATRADGRFEFERVPAKPLVLTRQTLFGLSGGQPVVPRAGETLTVRLGDKRRVATGKLDLSVVPGGGAKAIADPQTQIRARAFRLDPPPAMPPNWRDPAEWDAAVNSARSTEPPLMTPLASHANVAAAQLDGSLKFDDLLPGHYVMYVNVHAPPVPDVCGLGRVLASGRVELQVEESSANDATPLPAVPLTPRVYPETGDPAPALDAKTIAASGAPGDQPFSLEKLRGKVIVIDFWASWCAPCMAAMPEMKALHDKYANDARVAFVGGNFDWKAGVAEAALENLKLQWPQVALGELSFENPVCRAWGVMAIPSVWIISPDGKVLAKDLRGADVGKALEKAMKK